MKRVLILTASYGSGHVIAAKGLEEAFRAKGVEPIIFDIVLEGGRMEKGAARFYEFLMRRGHFAWRLFHERIMPLNRGNSIRALYKMLYRNKFLSEIENINPDIVVATMDTAALVASLYKLSHPNVKIYTVVTDFVAHPLWAWQNMDGYFVGSQGALEFLEKNGIIEENIYLYGIPLRRNFSRKTTKENARRSLGILKSQFVVVLSPGTFDSVDISEFLSILKIVPSVFVVVFAGDNKEVYKKYKDLLRENKLDGRVFKFTQDMAKILTASDLYVGKAGGLTVAECLAKGLPALYISNFPGHEEGNALYVARHGAAITVDSSSKLKEILKSLLKDPNLRAEMASQAAKLALPNASEKIIRKIIK